MNSATLPRHLCSRVHRHGRWPPALKTEMQSQKIHFTLSYFNSTHSKRSTAPFDLTVLGRQNRPTHKCSTRRRPNVQKLPIVPFHTHKSTHLPVPHHSLLLVAGFDVCPAPTDVFSNSKKVKMFVCIVRNLAVSRLGNPQGIWHPQHRDRALFTPPKTNTLSQESGTTTTQGVPYLRWYIREF
jgi:hypothetical protein